MVTEPTRNEHLLDLVLTDIPEAEITVGRKVQDHKFVLTKLNFSIPAARVLEREVWNFAKADWERMRDLLGDHDWSDLKSMSPTTAAASLTETILECAQVCIGKKTVREAKSTHPWMTERIVEATARKREAEGTNR